MNFLAIGVTALVTMVMGFIWYHPKVAGTVWMNETGMTEEKAQKGNMPLIFGLSYLLSFLLAMFLFNFVWHDGQPDFHTFQHGMAHGLMASIFIILPVMGTNALFEQKSFRYIMVNWAYWAMCFVIMGGILNIWR